MNDNRLSLISIFFGRSKGKYFTEEIRWNEIPWRSQICPRRTWQRNWVKHQRRSMLHFNILVIYFSHLPWHPAWQCETIVVLVVYSSKICALIPLDYTVRWISLARCFGKVISILMGMFVPPPGRNPALASLIGLPVTVLLKWTNLLSSSEHRIARQLQQKKGTRDNP